MVEGEGEEIKTQGKMEWVELILNLDKEREKERNEVDTKRGGYGNTSRGGERVRDVVVSKD